MAIQSSKNSVIICIIAKLLVYMQKIYKKSDDYASTTHNNELQDF